MDGIQFQISFRELRPIASKFYEPVCRKGINFQTSETTAGVLPIYDRTIVSSQSLQYDFY